MGLEVSNVIKSPGGQNQWQRSLCGLCARGQTATPGRLIDRFQSRWSLSDLGLAPLTGTEVFTCDPVSAQRQSSHQCQLFPETSCVGEVTVASP